MSDEIDKYELFFKKCTRMFTKSLARILSDKNTSYTKKLDYIHKIDRYIDKVQEKRVE